jgi:hypothetical protein
MDFEELRDCATFFKSDCDKNRRSARVLPWVFDQLSNSNRMLRPNSLRWPGEAWDMRRGVWPWTRQS